MHECIEGVPQKKFTLVERLATGGMGEVFLAKQEGPAGFVKTVVVKRLLKQLESDDSFVQMFLDEARVAAQLSHPNVVQVFELGESGEAYFLAMEYIDGRNLQQVNRALKRSGRSLPFSLAAHICNQALTALQYVHTATDAAGNPLHIIHRDVTPENVVIGFNGVVKLVDFGIAKAAVSQAITEGKRVKGKVHYLAPEVLNEGRATVRSDVYSMGVLLYEIVAGVRPFTGATLSEVLVAVLRRTPVPPRKLNPSVPTTLDDVIRRAMAKNPADRFGSAAEMSAALAPLLKPGTDRGTDALVRFMRELFAAMPPLAGPDTDVGVEVNASHLLPRSAHGGDSPPPLPSSIHASASSVLRPNSLVERLKMYLRSETPEEPPRRLGPGEQRVLQSLRTNESAFVLRSSVTVGGAPTNEVVVTGLTVPPQCGQLRLRGDGRWELIDACGLLRVNGKRCRKSFLREGDIVELGDEQFLFSRPVNLDDEAKTEAILPPPPPLPSAPPLFASFTRRFLRSPPGMVRVPGQTLRSVWGGEFAVREFFIDRTPVTNEQFVAFIEATGEPPPEAWPGRRPPQHESQHPVVGVDFETAARFARWRGGRLPTQLEWEAAARGTEHRAFPWGDAFDPDRCHGPHSGATATSAVGLRETGAAACGALDLVGNVWEWTDLDPVAQPLPDAGYAWVFGGSFCHPCDDRGHLPRRSVSREKDYRYLGFRCAKDLT